VISKINIGTSSAVSIIAFLLLMTAAITKAGAMPLHTWVPTSGEYAPTSVMALLPAAIDKLLGIYLLIIVVRQLFVLQHGALSLVLAIIGSATIIIAVMIAMVQHNLKKLLSYHAVSQAGYMILGIATMTPVGIAGGVFHMLNNAIYKCCLFLCGGAAEQQAGTADLEKLGGLGNRMPYTFATCMIAAVSISGIPPFNGFVSKWMVYQGVIKMGSAGGAAAEKLWPVWFVAAMFGSALTLASFVKVIHSVFLSRLPERLKDVKEVSIVQRIPMLVLAFLCVFFGIFYRVPLDKLIYPALGIEPGTAIFGVWDSVLATGFIVIGIAIGLIVLFAGSLSSKIRTVPTWTCGEIQDNDKMIIPGTHFYKTVSSMRGLKQLYSWQERRVFDLYDQGGKVGLGLTRFLQWLHCGILPMYLTWVTFVCDNRCNYRGRDQETAQRRHLHWCRGLRRFSDIPVPASAGHRNNPDSGRGAWIDYSDSCHDLTRCHAHKRRQGVFRYGRFHCHSAGHRYRRRQGAGNPSCIRYTDYCPDTGCRLEYVYKRRACPDRCYQYCLVGDTGFSCVRYLR